MLPIVLTVTIMHTTQPSIQVIVMVARKRKLRTSTLLLEQQIAVLLKLMLMLLHTYMPSPGYQPRASEIVIVIPWREMRFPSASSLHDWMVKVDADSFIGVLNSNNQG